MKFKGNHLKNKTNGVAMQILKNKQGFTLVELMVSIGLTGLLLSLTLGIFSRSLAFTRGVQGNLWAYEHVRTTLSDLSGELKSVCSLISGTQIFLGESGTFTRSGREISTDRLKFSTLLRRSVKATPFSKRAEVEYFWLDRGFSERELIRQVRYVSDEGVEEVKAKPVGKDILGVNFRYLDARGLWREEWKDDKELPRQIEITLFIQRSGDKHPKPFKTLITLP